ncbi:MAG: LysR family transcriptional regulator [Actinobacteria bacterium]|nr:LysR family transcriptional regulator [Actinomycetota bacterium]
MTLGQLRTFLEVARAGSVKGAAATLSVTEPSVSASVASLRRELGVELVERVGRGIRPTRAGLELARYAAQILGLADRATRAVQETAGDPGHLRLAAVTTAGEYVVPPLLATFLDAHPGVKVSLEVANRAGVFGRLLNQEADLAVGGRPPSGGDVEGYEFLDNELVVVGGPGRGDGSADPMPGDALSGETWLMREPGSGTRQTVEEFFSAAGIQPGPVLTISSNGAIKRAAAVGLGLTMLSMHAAGAEISSGELCRLNVMSTPLSRPWHVLYRRGAALPPSATAFLEFLRSSPLAGLPAAVGPSSVS